MSDRPADDRVGVRDADLASAAAVVVRFRRRRRAVVAAALSVGVAVVVSSAGLLPTATTSLVPTDDDTVTTGPAGVRATGTPDPSPLPDDPRGGDRPDATGGQGSAAPATEAAVPTTGDEVDSVPSRGGRRTPFRIPVVRSKLDGHRCGGFDLLETQRICTLGRASQQRSGSVVMLYDACLRPGGALWTGATARTLRFATAKEVDFAITTADGTIMWQWSTGQRFAKTPHTLSLDEDTCFRWRGRWTGVLDDGSRVKPGTYRLRASGRDADGALTRIVAPFQLSR